MNTVSSFKNGKITLSMHDDLFFLAFLLLFINTMMVAFTNLPDLFGSATNFIENLLYICFLAVCVISLFWHRKFQRTEFLSIIVILAAGIVTYLISGAHDFFDFVLLACIAKGVDFDKFVRRAVVFLSIFIVIVIGLSLVGLIGSTVSERADTSLVRNSLGFNHPNTLGMLGFMLNTGIVLMNRRHMRAVHYLILIGLTILCYLATRSYSSLLCSGLLIFLVFLYNGFANQKISSRQVRRIIIVILVLAVIALAVFVWYYWNHPDQLYRTLGRRITLAQKYLNAYGVNFFGHDILIGSRVALPGYSAGYSYLDNGEIWYLIKYGIAGFVIFFYTYIRMIARTINKKDFILCIVAIVYLVYSFTENTALRVSFNFMIPYACILLYDGHRIFTRRKASKDLARQT